MLIYHNHHILPRHAGGSNDPSNLIALTVAEHAEAHRLLFEENGRQEDKLAWLGLLALIGKDELLRERAALGGSRGKSKPRSPETIAKLRKPQKEGFSAKLSTRQLGNKHWTKQPGAIIDTSLHINKRFTCLTCGKTTNAGNLKRWHQH
jgi:hypothetical protein